jgi:hypothetical protein
MFRLLIFKLLDLWRFLKCENWHIIETDQFTDGTKITSYVYNGRLYTYIGDDFPPRTTSFSLPIRSAHVGNKNITKLVKRFMGPVGGQLPESGYMFPKKKFKFFCSFHRYRLSIGVKQILIKGEDVNIDVCNILGHWSVFGARKK